MKKRTVLRWIAALTALLALLPMTLVGCGKSEEESGQTTSETIKEKIPTDGGFYLAVPDETAKPGENVTVKLYLSGNPGIGGFSFCLEYDKTAFTMTDGKVTVPDNAFSACAEKDEGANFIWTSLTPYTEDGAFCELTLAVSEDAAPGNYPLKVVFREGQDSFYKIEGAEMPDLEITAIDGGITVEG